MTPPLTIRPPAAPQRRPRRHAAPRADPRILARRIAVRRSAGRKRLHRLLVVAAVLLVLTGAALSTRTPLLDVDHVEVVGTARVPAARVLEVATAAGAERGVPLVDIDEDVIERAIETLPAVASATVARRWPGTLEVEVVERTPVAVLRYGDTTALVAADGVVTALVSAAPPGVPALDGASADLVPGAVVDAPDLLAVAAALPPQLVAAVAAVAPGDGDGEIELGLAGGGVARLGPLAQLGDKLVAIVTVLEQLDTTCLAVLDVRVPSAPAVTRSAGCSA